MAAKFSASWWAMPRAWPVKAPGEADLASAASCSASSGAQGAPMYSNRAGVWHETKALQLADRLAADGHTARFVQRQRCKFVIAQMFHQHRGAPVDEPLRQSFMQSVRQPVFHRAGHLL